jgi:hypothetical protein
MPPHRLARSDAITNFHPNRDSRVSNTDPCFALTSAARRAAMQRKTKGRADATNQCISGEDARESRTPHRPMELAPIAALDPIDVRDPLELQDTP